jgi:hypothetical protein
LITTLIRKLPKPAEFCLVVFVCSWWAIYASIISIANQSWNTTSRVQEPFTGIGIELGERDHKVIIAQVVPGAPAAKAGLSRNLVIQKINDTNTDGKSPMDCASMVRGPAGSVVTFELIDTALNQTNTVAVTRGTIQGATLRSSVTDQTMLAVVLFELLGLAVTFWIARARGWPVADWGFRPSWKSTGAGVLLCLITALAIVVIARITDAIFPGLLVHRHVVNELSLAVLVLFSMTNAVFEEVLESGYFIQSLKRYGMACAVLASAVFRAFLHAYQGINALILILPLGLIFAFVYWKWRRLWPLFVAHVIFDLYAYFPK